MATDNVKVAVRLRPFNQRELTMKSKCVISMSGNTTVITHPQTGETKSFTFDCSYWSHSGYTTGSDGVLRPDPSAVTPYADQERVFHDLGQGVLDNAWQGYNAALFAYGQTGSGKSYSMLGYGPNKGIVPITCSQLFQAVNESRRKGQTDNKHEVTFSMIEIYNEQVRDLLAPSKGQPKGGLRVRQHPHQGFYVEGLKHVPTESYEQIEQLMEQGTVNRTTASTAMNTTSSRSHMVITITFKQIYKNEAGQSTTKSSRISLVDLAGSERANSTGATGDRLKEGSAINVSLSTLGKVISALAEMSGEKSSVVVPYRDSVLTKLLQTALGGNSKTVMIAALSPSHLYYDETLSTLRYADRTKNIKTQAVINEDPTDKLIRELTKEKNQLLEMMKQMQSGGSDTKIKELEQLLEMNRRQMSEMSTSWEQRLEAARLEWENRMGTSRGHTPRDDSQADETVTPHLLNVNEDRQLTAVIRIPLHSGNNLLGKSANPDDPTQTEIRGIGIHQNHVTLKNEGKEMILLPGDNGADVFINGRRIKQQTPLTHMDRVKLGSNNLYLYVGFPWERSQADSYDLYDYDFFLTELAEEAGVSAKVMRSLGEQSDDAGTTLVFQDYVKLLPKVYEANAMSQEMGRDVVFEAEIKNLAGYDDLGRAKQKQLIVKVSNRKTHKVWVWSREKFRHRKYVMEELYAAWADGESADVDASSDPFWDPVEDVYLGSCHVWLSHLGYRLDSDEYVDVLDHRGQQCATLHVKCTPCNKHGKVNKEEAGIPEPTLLLGKSLHFIVSMPQARDVLWVREDSSRGVYLCFSFYNQHQVIKTVVVRGSVNPSLDFRKTFSFPSVRQELLDYLKTHALVVELWGTQAEEKVARSVAGKVDTRRGSVPNGSLQRRQSIALLPQVSDSALTEMREMLARKERELSRIREQRDEAIEQLEKLQAKSQVSASQRATGQDGETARPLLRKRSSTQSLLARQISTTTPAQGAQSMDADMARALKIFFQDYKAVQVKLSHVIISGDNTSKLLSKTAHKEAMDTHQTLLHDFDLSLDNCVGQLKETMMQLIRRRRAQEKQHKEESMPPLR